MGQLDGQVTFVSGVTPSSHGVVRDNTLTDTVDRLREIHEQLEDGAHCAQPHHVIAHCRDLVADLIVDLERIGADPDRVRVEKLLTTRELEIARAVGAGMRNRAIAEDLYISETTVKFHMRNMMRKLGARSRSQIAAMMARTG